MDNRDEIRGFPASRRAKAVQRQPGIIAEFELDGTGAAVRLIAQPLGMFRPEKGDGA